MIPTSLDPITSLLPVTSWRPLLLLLIPLRTFFVWFSRRPGRDAKVTPIRASPFSPKLVPPILDTIVIGVGQEGVHVVISLLRLDRKSSYLSNTRNELVDVLIPFVWKVVSGIQAFNTLQKV